MAEPPDAVAAKLQKQLEYYFSDANLRRDAHLKGLAGANDDATLRQFVDLEQHLLSLNEQGTLADSVHLISETFFQDLESVMVHAADMLASVQALRDGEAITDALRNASSDFTAYHYEVE